MTKANMVAKFFLNVYCSMREHWPNSRKKSQRPENLQKDTVKLKPCGSEDPEQEEKGL
jgi:hypothetical protein